MKLAEPIDLEACLTSGQVFRWKQAGDRWVGVDGEHALSIRSTGPTELEVQGSEAAVASLFRLDWSYCDVIADLLELGPELAPLASSARGLRLMRPSCPRETLFCFLCTSNNHISRITQMVAKLAAFGEPLAGNPDETRFPSLERLAAIPESELRTLGFGYRAATIPRAAAHILANGGDVWLSELRCARYEAAYADMLALPGVGPKLADCICLYALDKTEAAPIDTHVWQAATRFYFPQWSGQPMTDVKRRAVGDFLRDRFGVLAGLAQQMLFYGNLSARRS